MKSTNQKTILIADDDFAILESIQLLLEMNGYRVLVTTGGDLIDLIKTHSPSLVLLDIWMGQIDGRSLCKEIKSTKSIAHTPVIMVSASNDMKFNFADSGAEDFVEKPFDIELLLKKIEKVAL